MGRKKAFWHSTVGKCFQKFGHFERTNITDSWRKSYAKREMKMGIFFSKFRIKNWAPDSLQITKTLTSLLGEKIAVCTGRCRRGRCRRLVRYFTLVVNVWRGATIGDTVQQETIRGTSRVRLRYHRDITSGPRSPDAEFGKDDRPAVDNRTSLWVILMGRWTLVMLKRRRRRRNDAAEALVWWRSADDVVHGVLASGDWPRDWNRSRKKWHCLTAL